MYLSARPLGRHIGRPLPCS